MSPAKIKGPAIFGSSERRQQQQPQRQSTGSSAPTLTQAADNGFNGSGLRMSSNLLSATSSGPSADQATEMKAVTPATASATATASAGDADAVADRSNLLLKLSDKPSAYLAILLGLQVRESPCRMQVQQLSPSRCLGILSRLLSSSPQLMGINWQLLPILSHPLFLPLHPSISLSPSISTTSRCWVEP